ncbi:transfer protein spdA [Streptomyces sp. NBC_00208]|uniref:transfer protein spdA n=1 Tax=Streptomyces sp. NBC_00208 TaxID=2975681 RepID=UPI002E290224|nr:transfer protein spdA [Streptomyces sp. NBC_00208]
MAISFTTQQHLAVTHGVSGWPSYAVPLAIDLFVVWAVRSCRDVVLAVAVAVSANVAGVLTAEPLGDVDTWVSAALHAVFPLTLWRMHRPARSLVSAEAPVVADPVPAVSVPAIAAPAPADRWPDADLWQDFEADSEDAEPVTPPSAEDVKAAMTVLESTHGRPVTGRMLADHFSVSERTGRRYLSMAA